MAETRHRSSDIPDFDTYPADPPKPEALPSRTIDSNMPLPRGQSNTALEQTARQVGTAVGKAVVTIRKTQERLKDVASQTGDAAASRLSDVKTRAQETANRVSNIGETVKNKAQEWTETATAKAEELRQVTVAKAEELRQATAARVSELGSQIKTGYYRTRLRANQVVRDYPLHVVLAAGAVGFLLGVGLRIWRANREY